MLENRRMCGFSTIGKSQVNRFAGPAVAELDLDDPSHSEGKVGKSMVQSIVQREVVQN